MKRCEEYEILISRDIDGDLSREEKARLEEHLSGCEHCSRYAQTLVTLSEAASGLEEEPPEGFARGVMYKIGLEKQHTGFFKRFGIGYFTIAAAAVVLVVFLSRNTGFLFSRSNSDMATAAEDGASAMLEQPQTEADSDNGEEKFGVVAGSAESPRLMTGSGGEEAADDATAESQQAPVIPYDQSFSSVVEVHGAVEGFDDYESVAYENRTEYFVPTDVLNAFIEDTQRETTVFSGDGYDPEARYGLLIVFTQ